MATGRLNFGDLSDSAYAHELRLGVSRLRFDDALERQYLAHHLRHVHLRVRVWFSLWLLLVLMFCVVEERSTGFDGAGFWMDAAGAFCASVLAWVTWSGQYERYFMPLARILVPVRSVLFAVLVAQVAAKGGYAEELMLLTVILFGVFFFSGLMFRAALVAALGIVIAFAATSMQIGLTPLALKSLVVLLMTALVGAIVHRDVEITSRKGFLEDALLAELSMRDGLTGLMNRRALDEHLLRVWQQGQRDRRTLAVMMVDIDHFKSFNDRYGHQAGDTALRRVAQLLTGFTRRPLDMAARYGGEEFVVVLYDLPQLNHVKDIADRIRQVVQDSILPLHDGREFPRVTVSIGVGMVEPTVGRTPQGALQFADEALYRAKEQGRNRVVFSDPQHYLESETGAFRKSGTVDA
jgi:diguanylate cyclase (GGDEF)-like protein